MWKPERFQTAEVSSEVTLGIDVDATR